MMDQQIFIEQWGTELENQLKEVVAVFQNLPEAALLQPSPTGGWSIAACLQHLNTYSNFYLPKLEHRLTKSSDQPQPKFRYSFLGSYFIRMMDFKRSKKKYKALKIHQPETDRDPRQVLSEFIDHLERLLRILTLAQTRELRKIKINTSLSSFVKMNAGDVIQFLLTHNRRHLEQAYMNLPKTS